MSYESACPRSDLDWAGLWRELSLLQLQRHPARAFGEDVWRERAREYQTRASQRWAKPDSSRHTVTACLAAAPNATLLDIGAGTGKWAVHLAPHVARITAMDPSPAMLAVMHENLTAEGITNVEIIQGAWLDVSVATHDFSLCGHAMYGCPDLPEFVTRMEQATRRTCFLILRAPAGDGVMAEAARHVWGHPFDSPNFQVAYNVLLQIGIRANVMFEAAGLWDPWTSATLDAALGEIKRRLMLTTDDHDAFLMNLVQRRLREEGGQFIWPRDMRSALVYWQARER